MDQYVGLDVSLKETFVCVVDACGEVVCEKSVGTTPETIAEFIEKRTPSAVRIGLESGLLSTWLWHGLRALVYGNHWFSVHQQDRLPPFRTGSART